MKNKVLYNEAKRIYSSYNPAQNMTKYSNGYLQEEKEPDFELSKEELEELNTISQKNCENINDIKISNAKGYITDDDIKIKFNITQLCSNKYAINNEIEAKLFYNEKGEEILEINYMPPTVNVKTNSNKYRKSYVGYIGNSTDRGDSFIPNKVTLLDKNNNQNTIDLRKAIKVVYNLNTGENNVLYRNCSLAIPKLIKCSRNHPDMYIKINNSNNNNTLLRLYKVGNSTDYMDHLAITSGRWSELTLRAHNNEETEEIKELFKDSDNKFDNLKDTMVKIAPSVQKILQSKNEIKKKAKRA